MAASVSRGKWPLIAVGVVLAIGLLGGLVAWLLLHDGGKSPVTTAAVDTIVPAPAPPAPKDVSAVPSLLPATQPEPTVPAKADATSVAAPTAPAEVPVIQPAPVTPTPVAEPPRPATPAPRVVEKPVRQKPAAPVNEGAMQDVALNLVRKGEGAFARQDYSTAIANARAALDVSPGLGRARKLLDEAQRAQQQAMNSISIQ